MVGVEITSRGRMFVSDVRIWRGVRYILSVEEKKINE